MSPSFTAADSADADAGDAVDDGDDDALVLLLLSSWSLLICRISLSRER